MGLNGSGKSHIIDAILSKKCADGQSVNELRSQMIHSEFNQDDCIVHEMTAKDIALLKLKYYPAVKEKLSFAEYQIFQKLYQSEKRKLDPDMDLKYVLIRCF